MEGTQWPEARLPEAQLLEARSRVAPSMPGYLAYAACRPAEWPTANAAGVRAGVGSRMASPPLLLVGNASGRLGVPAAASRRASPAVSHAPNWEAMALEFAAIGVGRQRIALAPRPQRMANEKLQRPAASTTRVALAVESTLRQAPIETARSELADAEMALAAPAHALSSLKLGHDKSSRVARWSPNLVPLDREFANPFARTTRKPLGPPSRQPIAVGSNRPHPKRACQTAAGSTSDRIRNPCRPFRKS